MPTPTSPSQGCRMSEPYLASLSPSAAASPTIVIAAAGPRDDCVSVNPFVEDTGGPSDDVDTIVAARPAVTALVSEVSIVSVLLYAPGEPWPLNVSVKVTDWPALTICGGAEIEKPSPAVLALVIAASSVPLFVSVTVSDIGTRAVVADR
jgi:hypothetical protein